MKTQKILKFITVLYVIGIATVSLITFHKMPKINLLNQDKPIHFLMYFGLSFLLSIIYNTKSFNGIKAITIFLISSGFGYLMELFQEFFTTSRTFDYKDILANTLGAIGGIIFAYLIKKTSKIFFFK